MKKKKGCTYTPDGGNVEAGIKHFNQVSTNNANSGEGAVAEEFNNEEEENTMCESYKIQYLGYNDNKIYEEVCDNKKEAVSAAKQMCELYATNPSTAIGVFGIQVLKENKLTRRKKTIFEAYSDDNGNWQSAQDQEQEVEEQNFCSKCGATLAVGPDGKFCPRCSKEKEKMEKEQQVESLKNKAYKIKNESVINKIDSLTDNHYDLLNQYSATSLTENHKKNVAKIIAEDLNNYLTALNKTDEEFYDI